MTVFLQSLLTASVHGSIVILAVLLLRLLLRKTPRKFICWLWMLAGIRLLMPIPVTSQFSLQPASITIPLPIRPNVALLLLWGGVAAAIGLASAASYLRLRHQVVDAVKVTGGWESDKIETAFVLGFMKPKIYIPTGMSGSTRQQILAHERTHLDKGDHWIKMIGFLALALHWFNPLVWVAYVLLCKDIELACDERVVQFMELPERKAYSSALLQCSTNRVHYAAFPVAFGEVSVKYRIQTVLNYRKPGFWISLLGVAAVGFVTLCLLTSPADAMQVVVDSQAELTRASHQDPEAISPTPLPDVGENPDWGIQILMDASSPTGGKLVYIFEERFMVDSETAEMTGGILERWNGSEWEVCPSLSGSGALFERYSIGFAQSREGPGLVNPIDLDWSLTYGALPAGDYRIRQTILSDTDSAEFYTGFRIYRRELPAQEEAALERCTAALNSILSKTSYCVLLSEESPAGNIQPVKRITNSGAEVIVSHYLGEYCTGTSNGENAAAIAQAWDAPFRLNQNRQFLFPEGKSKISQEEVTFCSVWTDCQGISYRGSDCFRFQEDGTLQSIQRLTETLDTQGSVTGRKVDRLDMESYRDYAISPNRYTPEDSFTAAENSPWNIFFRVDDDLLKPWGGEVWIGTTAIGVSNCTTDSSYWLEKRVDNRWERLGGQEVTGSWSADTIAVRSKTQMFQVNWSETYGNLGAGIYRMGKFFYSGSQSHIQYAEFEIAPTGGIFGPGGEAAIARVDDALEALKDGSYRVEVEDGGYSSYWDGSYIREVICKYGDTEAYTNYHASAEPTSYIQKPDNDFYQYWCKRSYDNEVYDCYYFPADYSRISDREITFAHTFSPNSDYLRLFTYRFDEAGKLTEINEQRRDSWGSRATRYIITDTPESEIRTWVENIEAKR